MGRNAPFLFAETMSINLITCNIKVPLKCILEMCIELSDLEELYFDVLNKGRRSDKYDLRFDGTDYFKSVTHILKKYAEGDIVLDDGTEFAWAYRFHEGSSHYVTWCLDSKFKLKPIKNDNS